MNKALNTLGISACARKISYGETLLKDIKNKKVSLYDYFDIEDKDRFIEELISKYDIEPTNYIVDIIYESIIKII